MRLLAALLSLISAHAFAQEHCISPDMIRAHAGDAVLGDFAAPGREMIALAAPGGQVTLLIFREDSCGPTIARLSVDLFRELAAFIGGHGA